MGLDDLLAGSNKNKSTTKKQKQKPVQKNKVEEKKEYKNILMTEEAIKLLHRVYYTEKMEKNLSNREYSLGDAVYDGLKLLAKKKGIQLTN